MKIVVVEGVRMYLSQNNCPTREKASPGCLLSDKPHTLPIQNPNPSLPPNNSSLFHSLSNDQTRWVITPHVCSYDNLKNCSFSPFGVSLCCNIITFHLFFYFLFFNSLLFWLSCFYSHPSLLGPQENLNDAVPLFPFSPSRFSCSWLLSQLRCQVIFLVPSRFFLFSNCNCSYFT